MARQHRGARKQTTVRVPEHHMDVYEQMAAREGVHAADIILRLAAMQAQLDLPDWLQPSAPAEQLELAS